MDQYPNPLSKPQPSNASKLISNLISSSTKIYMSKADEELKVNPQVSIQSDELREAYLQIIEKPDWKKQMEDSAVMISQDLMNDLLLREVKETRFTIAHSGNLYEFDSKVSKFITIGRMKDCDILFNGYGSGLTSRLHAMIMPLPQFGIYLVVDMGSYYGIDTLKRSSGKALISSHIKSRNILVFDWNEVAIFRMGSEKIGINPKECLICFEKPRDTTFNCGHHTVCAMCADRINRCPICREVIKKISYGLGMQTKGSNFSSN